MSIPGHGAIGHWAIGHPPGGARTFALNASPGAFAIAQGGAAIFKITEAASAGSVSIGCVTGSFTIQEAAGAGAFAYTGVAASFVVAENVSVGAITINGQSANESVLQADAPGAFTIAAGPANLVRTGDDYEFKLGGVGHFKFELEQARRLAAITRRDPPGFVDLRSKPQFKPFGAPPVAPSAPVVDLQAASNERMAAEMQAKHVAAKRRRDIEAILLLAS